MKVTAYTKNLAISPRKLRLVAKAVKGQSLEKTLSQLDYLPQKGAKMIKKTLNSAVANATNNFHLDEANLVIEEISVNEAGRYKRLDYSHGARFNSGLIQKRLSHLQVVLAEKKAAANLVSDQKVAVKPTKKVGESKTASVSKKPAKTASKISRSTTKAKTSKVTKKSTAKSAKSKSK